MRDPDTMRADQLPKQVHLVECEADMWSTSIDRARAAWHTLAYGKHQGVEYLDSVAAARSSCALSSGVQSNGNDASNDSRFICAAATWLPMPAHDSTVCQTSIA